MNRLTFSLMVAAVLGMVPTVFGMVACGGPPAGTGGAGGAQTTTTDTSPACSASVEVPCMRYTFTLDGDPSNDAVSRNKYIAAFGDACYMSEVNTFGCFYQKPKAACADAVNMAEVYGAAAFEKGPPCLKDDAGTGAYWLQVGADPANNIPINYQNAPRQTPLTEVDGAPMAVNGPYRNLVQAATVQPGKTFHDTSGVSNGDGGLLDQQEWILQVNRDAHNGKIYSDLAGFEWTCPGSDGGTTTCTELDVLEDPDSPQKSSSYADTGAQVHHVVPMKDPRCCPWGTNANANAAVISGKLNRYFLNKNPPAKEVKQLNEVKPYTP